MSTKLLIVGILGTLCPNVGFAGTETPAGGPEAALPAPLRWGPTREGPLRPGPPAPSADAEQRQLEFLTFALDLSEEQRTAFAQILEERRAQLDAWRGQLREGRRKLAEAFAAAKPVPATVGALMIEQRTLHRKRETARDEVSQALRALLTDEQRARLDSLPKPGPHGRGEPGTGPMARGGSPMACDMGPMGCGKDQTERASGMRPAPVDPPPGAEPPWPDDDRP